MKAMTTSAWLVVRLVILLACVPAGGEPLSISGIHPDLTAFSENGEVGIGAVVPWADRLWFLTYPPHQRHGGDDKLYTVDAGFKLTIRPESVGGTHAARMIHRESNQLLIGPYVISADGKVRSFDVKKALPGRLTAIARHLTDPAHKVYYVDMEGPIWEADVYTLETRKLFEKPVPGWHSKGAYTAQGRLVVSNNGESPSMGDLDKAKITADLKAKDPEDAGVLGEWDGKEWHIVARRQFVDVTGPGGIYGNAKDDDPLWSIGWDKRSVILKLLDGGVWSTYRLPKATHTYDPKHGWYTEWPRIRQVTDGRWMLDMHGMFFDFPQAFRAAKTGGIRPIASHLRYVPDFCQWGDKLVLAADDTSIMQNPMAGISQSNLWFGKVGDLSKWGPGAGWGGPWVLDMVKAGEASEPFLVAGFAQRVLHLSHDADAPVKFTIEIDAAGDGKWKVAQTVEVPAKGYVCHTLPKDLAAEWLRITADRACTATAFFHLFSPRDSSQDSAADFAALAPVDSKDAVIGGLIRPGKNRNLQFVARRMENGQAQDVGYFEMDAKLLLAKAGDDQSAEVNKIAAVKTEFSVDEASVLMTQGGKRYRLPKTDAAYDKAFALGWPRTIRECVSERNIVNVHGTFYEMGRDAAMGTIKPIATHRRQIMDFCTWRGLLVLSGVRASAKPDGHCFISADGQAGVWLGCLDDMWRMGKPVGHGGPWKDTTVKAGAFSDPYLMTGFDAKTLTLSHDRADAVEFKLEVNFDHQQWQAYRTISVPAGAGETLTLPAGPFAHWLRVKTAKDCRATATLVYE